MLSRPTPLGPRRTASTFILIIEIKMLTTCAEPMISIDLIRPRDADVVTSGVLRYFADLHYNDRLLGDKNGLDG